MKPITYLSILAVVLLSACSVFQGGQTGRNEDAPVPDKSMAMRSNTPLDVIQTGHAVYMRKCGECHTHVLPSEVNSDDWHIVVPGMAWNAGISPTEEKALIKYIIAAKSNQ